MNYLFFTGKIWNFSKSKDLFHDLIAFHWPWQGKTKDMLQPCLVYQHWCSSFDLDDTGLCWSTNYIQFYNTITLWHLHWTETSAQQKRKETGSRVSWKRLIMEWRKIIILRKLIRVCFQLLISSDGPLDIVHVCYCVASLPCQHIGYS